MPEFLEEGEAQSTITTEEVPTGSLTSFENSVPVQSAISLQIQYVPRGTKRFKDFISGEIEAA